VLSILYLPDRRTMGCLAGVLTCEKDPPTLHTIQPPYSQFMVKAPPPSVECLLYALLFVCFHVFWKQQPFTPLLRDAWWYNDADPQTGNNLELFLCVRLRLCPFILLCVVESVCECLWNNCANCCVKIALRWRGSTDQSGVICSVRPCAACCWYRAHQTSCFSLSSR